MNNIGTRGATIHEACRHHTGEEYEEEWHLNFSLRRLRAEESSKLFLIAAQSCELLERSSFYRKIQFVGSFEIVMEIATIDVHGTSAFKSFSVLVDGKLDWKFRYRNQQGGQFWKISTNESSIGFPQITFMQNAFTAT